MPPPFARKPMPDRILLAEQLRAWRHQVAARITDEFLVRHPDWVIRYGDRARHFGVEDAVYHQEFLAAAIESGEPTAFASYLGWTAGVLGARGISQAALRETVDQISVELQSMLAPAPAADLAAFIAASLQESPLGAAALAATAGSGSGGIPCAITRDGALSSVQSLFLQAILRGHRDAAVLVAVESVRQGHPIADVYSGVLQESMYEVGRLWETNRITVAQEHMATAITQYVIAHLYPLIPTSSVQRGRMVITGVEGEQHQVGPNIIADVLECAGWDVRFLGTNTPIVGVLQAIEEHRADVLGISATMLFNIPNVRRLIARAQALPNRNLRVILGGSAFRAAPEIYKELGAVGVALDVSSALQLASTL